VVKKEDEQRILGKGDFAGIRSESSLSCYPEAGFNEPEMNNNLII
jgi:hypothetical protein